MLGDTPLKLNGTFCAKSPRGEKKKRSARPTGRKFRIFMLSFIFHVHAKLVRLRVKATRGLCSSWTHSSGLSGAFRAVWFGAQALHRVPDGNDKQETRPFHYAEAIKPNKQQTPGIRGANQRQRGGIRCRLIANCSLLRRRRSAE